MSLNSEKIESADVGKNRAKWITLIVLFAWVIAVFVATVLKFAKVW